MVAELSRRGDYSVLRYTQPSVPQQPTNSQGVSFNGVQNIDSQWGLFLRANYVSGTVIPIETSIAWGEINDNPFHCNKLDQVGLGLFWDKTNRPAVGQPVRNAEWGVELYDNYTLFKALRLTALTFRSISTRPCTRVPALPRSLRSEPRHSSGVLLSAAKPLILAHNFIRRAYYHQPQEIMSRSKPRVESSTLILQSRCKISIPRHFHASTVCFRDKKLTAAHHLMDRRDTTDNRETVHELGFQHYMKLTAEQSVLHSIVGL